MEEIVLTSDTHALTLRNKGYRFKHIKTGKFYILITKIKSKNNLNGDWYDAFSILIISNKSSVVAVKVLFLTLKL
jgi:hypothetical protein